MALDLTRDVPERNVSGLPVTELSVEGARLKYTVPDAPGGAAFDLTLRGDNLAGTLSVNGQPIPIEIKRTGEVKVELVAASPAVTATIDSPSLGAAGLPLMDVIQKGREVEFSVRIYGGHFQGTLEGNQLIGE